MPTVIPIHDNGEPLVDLAELPFVLEPVYFERRFSDVRRMLLREGAAERLVHAQSALPPSHRFKIWDAWRPREVQVKLYASYREELRKAHPEWSSEELTFETRKFVNPGTDPDEPPSHSTGGAVDLTIVDGKGRALDMGTPFDHLGPESAALYFEDAGRDARIRENRRLLRGVMSAAGFAVDADEWWDFNYGTQAWAAKSGKAFAMYGEKTGPD